MQDLPVYRIKRLNGSITVDGRLEEPAWQDAEPINLALTDDGGKPLQETTARMLWDDEKLYVGFRCKDNDIWGTMAERDDPICKEEVVEVFFSPRQELNTYYEIEISPLNVIFDLVILNDLHGHIEALDQWNCKDMETAVYIEGEVNKRNLKDEYWSVEIAIPFKSLYMAPGNPPRPGDEWRLNLYRIDRAREVDEYSAWSPTGKINFHIPQKFGRVIFE